MNQLLPRARKATAAFLSALILLSPGMGGYQVFAIDLHETVGPGSLRPWRGGIGAPKTKADVRARKYLDLANKTALSAGEAPGAKAPQAAAGDRQAGRMAEISKGVEDGVKIVGDSSAGSEKVVGAGAKIEKSLEEDFANPAEHIAEAYEAANATREAKRAGRALKLLKPGSGAHVHFGRVSGVMGTDGRQTMRYTFYMTSSPQSERGKAIHVDVAKTPGVSGRHSTKTVVESESKVIPHQLFPEMLKHFARGSLASPRSVLVSARKKAGFMGEKTEYAMRFRRDEQTGDVDLWYELKGVPSREGQAVGAAQVNARTGEVLVAAKGDGAPDRARHQEPSLWRQLLSAFETIGEFGKGAATAAIFAAWMAKASNLMAAAAQPFDVDVSGAAASTSPVQATAPHFLSAAGHHLQEAASWTSANILPGAALMVASAAIIYFANRADSIVGARINKLTKSPKRAGDPNADKPKGWNPFSRQLLVDLGRWVAIGFTILVAVQYFGLPSPTAKLAGMASANLGSRMTDGAGLAFAVQLISRLIKDPKADDTLFANLAAGVRIAIQSPRFQYHDVVRFNDGKEIVEGRAEGKTLTTVTFLVWDEGRKDFVTRIYSTSQIEKISPIDKVEKFNEPKKWRAKELAQRGILPTPASRWKKAAKGPKPSDSDTIHIPGF